MTRKHSAIAAALAKKLGRPLESVEHSIRFRKVAELYPRRVAEAYGDISAAAADSDEEVAAKVAAWERRNGLTVLDWYKVGRRQRGPAVPGEAQIVKEVIRAGEHEESLDLH